MAMAMAMDMVLEESALELVFTPLGQSMNPGQPRVLASAVPSLGISDMGLLLMAMLSEVSALELVFTPQGQSMSLGQPRALASAVPMLSQGTLVLAMVMVMALVESALVLV